MTVNNTAESFLGFMRNTAEKWQSYMEYDFLEDIKLSSDQRRVIDQEDPQMMILGSAGSGKSIALLYKMIKTMVTEKEQQRMLFISYNQSLIEDARKRAQRSAEYNLEKNHHDVYICTFHKMAQKLLETIDVPCKKVYMTFDQIEHITDRVFRRVAAAIHDYKDPSNIKYKNLDSRERLYKTHTTKFIRDEILWIKANGYIKREDYLEATRSGRGNIPRLTKAQRNTIFNIYELYQSNLVHLYNDDMDLEDYALRVLKYHSKITDDLKYDYIFVDEVQDLQPMQIKVLTFLAKKSIVLSGDPKQRIYKTSPHSYTDLGLGKLRSRNLIDNFRSTKQIIKLANSLQFIDTNNDKESNIRYIKQGPKPKINLMKTEKDCVDYLIQRIKKINQMDPAGTIAVIIRDDSNVNKGIQSPIGTILKQHFLIIDIENYGRQFSYEESKKQIILTDVYSVKGLEFDYVFIMNFDKYHYPHKDQFKDLEEYTKQQGEVEGEELKKDRESIMNDEKKRLYVAMSRAKKELELLCSGRHADAFSPFILDFDSNDYEGEGFNNNKIDRYVLQD